MVICSQNDFGIKRSFQFKGRELIKIYWEPELHVEYLFSLESDVIDLSSGLCFDNGYILANNDKPQSTSHGMYLVDYLSVVYVPNNSDEYNVCIYFDAITCCN